MIARLATTKGKEGGALKHAQGGGAVFSKTKRVSTSFCEFIRCLVWPKGWAVPTGYGGYGEDWQTPANGG